MTSATADHWLAVVGPYGAHWSQEVAQEDGKAALGYFVSDTACDALRAIFLFNEVTDLDVRFDYPTDV